MKAFRFIAVLLILIFLFSANAYADDYGATEKIHSLLPREARELLEENGLSVNNGEIAESLDTAGFFSLIASFFKEGFSAVAIDASRCMAVIILSSLMVSYCGDNKTSMTVQSVCMASGALILTVPIYEMIAAAKEALTATSVFLGGAVPVFAALKAVSGKAVSVTGGSATVLFACQCVSYICAFVFAPFMNGYLALGICSAFGGKNAASGIMGAVKKVTNWVLSLLFSVFLFVLSAKGIAGKSADTLALKTAKFVLGTTLPVVGNALSESAGGVASAISALSGTAGIYVIIGAVAIMLPLLTTLFLRRIMLIVLKYLSVLFSLPSFLTLSEALENVTALLMGFCLLSLALFIISMGVLIAL